MAISNEERLPGAGNIVSGTLGPRTGLKAPGILFYNEKSDECGGLTYVSEGHDGKFVAGSLLTFDKYHGDQVLAGRPGSFFEGDRPAACPAMNSRMVEAFVSKMHCITNLPVGSITVTEIVA